VTGLALAWLVTLVPAVAQNAYITNQGVYPNFSNKLTVIDTTTNNDAPRKRVIAVMEIPQCIPCRIKYSAWHLHGEITQYRVRKE
jgi:hypothetical protein